MVKFTGLILRPMPPSDCCLATFMTLEDQWSGIEPSEIDDSLHLQVLQSAGSVVRTSGISSTLTVSCARPVVGALVTRPMTGSARR